LANSDHVTDIISTWIFSLKMISDITVELQVPLSTLFSSVILHYYVELLHKNNL